MDACSQKNTQWFSGLDDEDRQFLKRFVLASGSLKEVARQYGISYPTVRLRLDRIIAKIEILESHQSESDFHRLVRTRVVDGRIEMQCAKELLAAFETEVERRAGDDRSMV